MAFVSNALKVLWTALLVLDMVLLIRGPLNRYFALFLFLLTTSLTGITQTWALTHFGARSSNYFNIFWGAELLFDFMIFFLVIWLTAYALEGSPHRKGALKFLGIILVVVLAVPFVVFHYPVFSRLWNNATSQLLNFGAAVMNLGLWTALLMSKNRDRQLFTVSAGLGVIVAGAAVALGGRQLTDQESILRDIADQTYGLTQIAGPAIWCWAFWPKKKRSASVPSPQGGGSPSPSVS